MKSPPSLSVKLCYATWPCAVKGGSLAHFPINPLFPHQACAVIVKNRVLARQRLPEAESTLLRTKLMSLTI